MKIKRIEIENFRCYKDKQVLEFDLDGKITLIFGLSGHGKSTLQHFIKWMFYDIFPTRKKGEIRNEINYSTNIDPIYNEVAYESYPFNKDFVVYGSIEFVHKETEFHLIKEYKYSKRLTEAKELNRKIILNYKESNGSWVPYKGDIYEKINSIIPKALSKYFFFSGEENVIEDSNDELKKSIYSLFGLTKYENAINHLGDKNRKNSVINKYETEKNKNVRGNPGKVNDLLQEITKYQTAYDDRKEKIKKLTFRLNTYRYQYEQLVAKLAELNKSEDYKTRILELKDNIKLCEQTIDNIKKEIGNNIYKAIPYIILSDKVKYTRNILEQSAKNEKTFKHLVKPTLQDILDQNECVCGNCLTESMRIHIKNLINSMPPNSYSYTYNQFVQNVEYKESLSITMLSMIKKKLESIAENKVKIHKYHTEYTELLEKISNSNEEQIKKLGKEIKDLEKIIDDAKVAKYKLEQEMKKCELLIKENEKKYREALQYENIMDEYKVKLEILNNVRTKLIKIYESQKNIVAQTLNETIIDVYNKLSTRVEFFNNKNFLNDDFTLRDEYKTGGQEIVDVFSYIIGMINALHITNNDEGKEFPVVIDAPFSKTDHIQMSHVISTITEIVPQTVMLTFDIIRIKEECDLSQFGKVWFIQGDESQKVSFIKKGEL